MSMSAARSPMSRPPIRRGAAAEPPLASIVLADRSGKMGLGKIGPERVDENELGVGRLPDQEVAQALLTAGADQQVRVGQAGGREVRCENFLVDLVGAELAGGGIGGDAAGGIDDFILAAVVESDGELEAGIAARAILRLIDQGDDVGLEMGAGADDAD